MTFDPAPLIKLLGRGIGGAGTSRHVAGISRLAIIVLAMNAQSQAENSVKIIEQLASIERHIDATDQRVTFLENEIQMAYDTANRALPLPLKNHEAQNEHSYQH